jgi:hypothetical protein
MWVWLDQAGKVDRLDTAPGDRTASKLSEASLYRCSPRRRVVLVAGPAINRPGPRRFSVGGLLVDGPGRLMPRRRRGSGSKGKQRWQLRWSKKTRMAAGKRAKARVA